MNTSGVTLRLIANLKGGSLEWLAGWKVQQSDQAQRCTRLCGALIVAFFLFSVHECTAQQIRYMDSSGNIHFVDNVYQVPQRYREQVITPTPVPVLDRKAMAEKKRQEAQARRDKVAEDRRKKVEQREKAREEKERKEEEARKNRRKGQSTGFGKLY